MGKDPYPGFYPPERGRGFPFPDPLLEGASSPLRGKEVWGTGNGGGGEERDASSTESMTQRWGGFPRPHLILYIKSTLSLTEEG
jgi:hypothetical protein